MKASRAVSGVRRIIADANDRHELAHKMQKRFPLGITGAIVETNFTIGGDWARVGHFPPPSFPGPGTHPSAAARS